MILCNSILHYIIICYILLCKEDLPLVLELLEAKADPNEADKMGETPLFEAAASGNPDLVAAMLVHFADPNVLSGGMTPRAVTFPEAVAARTLLDLFEPREVDTASKLAALEAVSPSLRSKVLLRLEAMGSAPEAATTRRGSLEQPPAAAGTAEEEPLALQPAAEQAARATVRSAVEKDDLALVLQLLEAKADPNEADETGETPLFEAADRGNPDIVAVLLVHSADPNVTRGGFLLRDLAQEAEGAVAARTLLDLFEPREVDTASKLAALEAVSPSLRSKVLLHLEAMGSEPEAATTRGGALEQPPAAASQPAAVETAVQAWWRMLND